MDNFFEKTLHDPTAFFTLLLFFATFALWWATRRLVVGAEESSQRQMRAYLSAKPTLVFNWTGIEAVGVRLITTNHGLTPAVELAVELLMQASNQPFDPRSVNTQSDFNNSIFPQQNMEIDVFMPRPEREILDAVERNELRIYVYGRISYADVFGRRHSTLVNASFGGPDFSRKIRRGDGTGWNWLYNQSHNQPTSI